MPCLTATGSTEAVCTEAVPQEPTGPPLPLVQATQGVGSVKFRTSEFGGAFFNWSYLLIWLVLAQGGGGYSHSRMGCDSVGDRSTRGWCWDKIANSSLILPDATKTVAFVRGACAAYLLGMRQTRQKGPLVAKPEEEQGTSA